MTGQPGFTQSGLKPVHEGKEREMDRRFFVASAAAFLAAMAGRAEAQQDGTIRSLVEASRARQEAERERLRKDVQGVVQQRQQDRQVQRQERREERQTGRQDRQEERQTSREERRDNRQDGRQARRGDRQEFRQQRREERPAVVR